MIKDVYITRIDNIQGERQFGFGVTTDDKEVYIPGFVVDNFDLTEDDIGTLNKMSVMPDAREKADFVVTAFLIEDSALHQAYEWAKEEIERLQGLLKENGVEY